MSNHVSDVSNDHWTCGIQFSTECNFAMNVGAFIVLITNSISTVLFSIGRSDINKGAIGALVVLYTGLDGNGHDYLCTGN